VDFVYHLKWQKQMKGCVAVQYQTEVTRKDLPSWEQHAYPLSASGPTRNKSNFDITSSQSHRTVQTSVWTVRNTNIFNSGLLSVFVCCGQLRLKFDQLACVSSNFELISISMYFYLKTLYCAFLLFRKITQQKHNYN
jgi:hypothetical protein